MAELVPDRLKFQALMHDATEAHLGDMVKSLKRSMREYRAAEDRLWWVITRKFGLPIALDPEVKRADLITLATEWRDLLFDPYRHEWAIDEDVRPAEFEITPLDTEEAEGEFLERVGEWAGRNRQATYSTTEPALRFFCLP